MTTQVEFTDMAYYRIVLSGSGIFSEGCFKICGITSGMSSSYVDNKNRLINVGLKIIVSKY
jgi:hypothetical protein